MCVYDSIKSAVGSRALLNALYLSKQGIDFKEIARAKTGEQFDRAFTHKYHNYRVSSITHILRQGCIGKPATIRCSPHQVLRTGRESLSGHLAQA